MNIRVQENFDGPDYPGYITETPVENTGKTKVFIYTCVRPIFWAHLTDTRNVDRFERTGRP